MGLFNKAKRTPAATLEAGQGEVTYTNRDGKVTVRFDALDQVSIRTTDQGPLVDDVFFVLRDRNGELTIPSETPGASELLVELQQLPGFDSEAVVLAMGSCENATFVCWERPAD